MTEAESAVVRVLPSGSEVLLRWEQTGDHRALVATAASGEVTLADLADIFRHALAIDVPVIAVAECGVVGDFAVLPSGHGAAPRIYVGPAPAPLAEAALAESGALLALTGGSVCGPVALRGDSADESLQRALLLLSYLPASAGGALPVYRERDPRGEARVSDPDRNAADVLYAMADDALFLWPGGSDELLVAICRLGGRSALGVLPQPVAGQLLGVEAGQRLVAATLFAVAHRVPLFVLGALQPLDGEADQVSVLTSLLGAARSLVRCVTVAPEDAPDSLGTVLRSAPTASVLPASSDVRARLKEWLAL